MTWNFIDGTWIGFRTQSTGILVLNHQLNAERFIPYKAIGIAPFLPNSNQLIPNLHDLICGKYSEILGYFAQPIKAVDNRRELISSIQKQLGTQNVAYVKLLVLIESAWNRPGEARHFVNKFRHECTEYDSKLKEGFDREVYGIAVTGSLLKIMSVYQKLKERIESEPNIPIGHLKFAQMPHQEIIDECNRTIKLRRRNLLKMLRASDD